MIGENFLETQLFLKLIFSRKKMKLSLFFFFFLIPRIFNCFNRTFAKLTCPLLAVNFYIKWVQYASLTLRFQHKGVFDMIRKHDLYIVIQDKIEQLMELDIDQCILMLTDKDKIDSRVVVAKLEHKPIFLYLVSVTS